jgi:hypothetical protein
MNDDRFAVDPASPGDRLRAALDSAPYEDEELSEDEQAALNELNQLRDENTVDSGEVRQNVSH